MSEVRTATDLIGIAANLVRAMLVPKRRRLLPMSGIFVPPTVWIEEQHRDQLVITEHPVEQGTVVTDHAFMRPAECTIRVGWRGEPQTEISTIYAFVISLQRERVLFDLWTGKRKYINMLAQQVAVSTDEKTENVLLAVITCREVILVSHSTTMVPADPNAATEKQKTVPPANSGPSQLQPAPTFNPAGLPPIVTGVERGGT